MQGAQIPSLAGELTAHVPQLEKPAHHSEDPRQPEKTHIDPVPSRR